MRGCEGSNTCADALAHFGQVGGELLVAAVVQLFLARSSRLSRASALKTCCRSSAASSLSSSES